MRACGFGSLAIFCVMVGMSFNARAAFQAGGFLTMMMALILIYKAWEAPQQEPPPHRAVALPPEGTAPAGRLCAMGGRHRDARDLPDVCALDVADRDRDVGPGAGVLAVRAASSRATGRSKRIVCDNLDIASGREQTFCACRKSPNRARQTPVRPREAFMSISKRQLTTPADSLTPVAGNGLLHRRALLGRGILLAGAAATGCGASGTSAAAEPLKDDPWSQTWARPSPPRQEPSRFEKHVVRTLEQSQPRAAQLARPHAASSDQRHASRRRRCTSPSTTPACRISTRPSIAW